MENLNYPLPSRLKVWLDLSEALAVAADTGLRRLHNAMHKRRQAVGRVRHPGADSPMWNVCRTLLRQELKSYGSKARLARYLGLPRQRLNNFLIRHDRMPDAEILLRMLHWLSARQEGRDLSLLGSVYSTK